LHGGDRLALLANCAFVPVFRCVIVRYSAPGSRGTPTLKGLFLARRFLSVAHTRPRSVGQRAKHNRAAVRKPGGAPFKGRRSIADASALVQAHSSMLRSTPRIPVGPGVIIAGALCDGDCGFKIPNRGYRLHRHLAIPLDSGRSGIDPVRLSSFDETFIGQKRASKSGAAILTRT
jgi:hypothetical protein